jgi:hypothetical protein
MLTSFDLDKAQFDFDDCAQVAVLAANAGVE